MYEKNQGVNLHAGHYALLAFTFIASGSQHRFIHAGFYFHQSLFSASFNDLPY